MDELIQLVNDAVALKRAGIFWQDPSRAALPELSQALFLLAGAPVRLDDILSVIADVQGVHDRGISLSSNLEHDFDVLSRPAEVSTYLPLQMERRSYLRRLWAEISQLPRFQRVALLLNLRDAHEGVIVLLPLAGVASIRQIAGVLEVSAEELSKWWNDLPFEDEAIAALLNVTRQQVINLRKAARARLGRRMTALQRQTKPREKVISRDVETS